MSQIPVVGAVGLYTLTAPFNNAILPGVAYECVALRTMAEMQSWGKDPFTYVYAPQALSIETYQADAKAGVFLATLRASSGHQLVVPTSYIQECPVIGGVPYNVMVLAVKLGALPDTLPLEALKAKIVDLTRDNIGVEPEVKEVKLSQTTLIGMAEHIQLEAARALLIASNTTLTSENTALVAENQQLRTQLEALQDYIQNNP